MGLQWSCVGWLETTEQFCCVLGSGHPDSEEVSLVITCQVTAVENSTDAVGLSAGISFFWRTLRSIYSKGTICECSQKSASSCAEGCSHKLALKH